MAFLGRGGFPSMGGNHHIGNKRDRENNSHFGHRYYYGRRIYYYVPLDNTYVLMQMIVTFLILIVGVITFISTYESTTIDPIENTKRLFINIYLIIIAILIVAMFIINFSSKNESILINRLILLFLISMIIMFVFCGIKLNLDSTYNVDRFEQFYLSQNVQNKSSKDSTEKSKISIGLTGVSLKSEKEYYIDECVKLYDIFKTKTYGILGLHLLLNVLLIYQISKVIKIKNKKERLNKDDAIVYDEEQNVRF